MTCKRCGAANTDDQHAETCVGVYLALRYDVLCAAVIWGEGEEAGYVRVTVENMLAAGICIDTGCTVPELERAVVDMVACGDLTAVQHEDWTEYLLTDSGRHAYAMYMADRKALIARVTGKEPRP